MKKPIKVILSIIILLAIMYAEYKFIIYNQRPYLGKDGAVYIELFNRIDEYYAEPAHNINLD